MLSVFRHVISAAIKGIAAVALAGMVFWQVAKHSGATKGIAYVHVAVPRVDLSVDDSTYQIDSLWETPIVCELRPGRHLLRMSQHEQVLYEEEFNIGAGEELVLTAWDQGNKIQSSAPSGSLSLNEIPVAPRPDQRIP
jgi:hypothetical protein